MNLKRDSQGRRIGLPIGVNIILNLELLKRNIHKKKFFDLTHLPKDNMALQGGFYFTFYQEGQELNSSRRSGP